MNLANQKSGFLFATHLIFIAAFAVLFFSLTIAPANAATDGWHIKDDSTGGECSLIGNWDAGSKTCTLSQDLSQGIIIDSNLITLDGNGHAITGIGSGIGIYAQSKSEIIVTNFTISKFYDGIVFCDVNNSKVSNNIVTNNLTHGITFNPLRGENACYVGSPSNNVVEDNTLEGNITYADLFPSSGGLSILQFYHISIGEGNYNVIQNNTVGGRISGGIVGIELFFTNGSKIVGNKIKNISEGITLSYASNNLVKNNSMWFVGQGIAISWDSFNNEVAGNTVTKYSYGIRLSGYNNKNNKIYNNTLEDVYYGGLGLILFNSTGNEIYNNNFVNNPVPVFFMARDNTNNVFYLNLPIGGNYWSNFDEPAEGCTNANNDSFCDAPYTFTGGQDNLPWTKKDGWLAPPNQPPVLSFPETGPYAGDGIDPNMGTANSTPFTFKLIYTDADNDQPSDIALVVDDGATTTRHSMTLDTEAADILRDGNYASGEQYAFSAQFPKGEYQYHFEAADGKGGTARVPTTGELHFSVINIPVIIVPGIMGSYLYDANETHDSISCSERELWPNICKIQSNQSDDFRKIKLMDDGIQNEDGRSIILGNEINDPGIIRLIDKLSGNSDIFKSLVDDLKMENYSENSIDNQDLFTFPYDWRLDIATTSTKLKDKIDSIISQTGSKKVNIIAHSMGGLLTKYYTAQYGSTKINKIIFIGVPHLGAPKAFKTLMYGDENFALGFWGLDAAIIKEISRNMPSAYQLLPSEAYTKLHKYIWNLTATDNNNITGQLNYQQTKQVMINVGKVNESLFKNAESLHGLVDTPGIDAIQQIQGAKTFNIIGCGEATIGEIRMLNKKMPGLEKYEYALRYIDGDETVPVLSAKSFGNNNNKFFVKDATHIELPSANGIREFIAYLIAGSKFDILDHKNIASDENICNFAGKAVSFHSPIELHIYDSQNRHTGPTADGFIENNIPGVQYDVIEDNKFAFLPDGETYTITGQATGIGTFNARIATYENSEVTETRYYNEIPLKSLETNTTFTITPNQIDYAIKIDQDGNGIFESQAQPSSVLNAEESQDLTKPETTISLSGNQGQNNWYVSDVKIGFSATDDNSGILKTEYSLDNGQTWNIYQQPFTIAAEGATSILYLSTDRAGNYELLKSQEIKIDKTPPEAKISFDQNLKQLKIEGVDNLSSVAIVQNGNNYTLTDEAGHTLVVAFDKLKTEGKEIKAEISALRYDGILAPAIPENKLQYEWSLEKSGNIKELNQRIEIKKTLDVRARYDGKKNETIIDTKTGEEEKKSNQIFQGFTALILTTNSGNFDIKSL